MNSSPFPRSDDKIYMRSETMVKTHSFTDDEAAGHVMMASFTQCDRPLHLIGFGASEADAIADLYRELRDYDKKEERAE